MLPEKLSVATDAKTAAPAPSKINALFISQGNKMSSELESLIEKKSIIKGSKELRSYLISVHGLRSALMVMGRPDLSATAASLENFSREENTEMIYAETPAFLEDLRAFITEITALSEKSKDGKANLNENEEDKQFLCEKLQIIQSACERYNDLVIESTLEQLRTKQWSQTTDDLLTFISDHLLFGDFPQISETVQSFIE